MRAGCAALARPEKVLATAAAPRLGCARLHGCGVGSKHGVRVQQCQEGVEVTAACGGEEGVDDVSLPGQIGLGGCAPCTRRRAQLASCRAAAGERSTIAARVTDQEG